MKIIGLSALLLLPLTGYAAHRRDLIGLVSLAISAGEATGSSKHDCFRLQIAAIKLDAHEFRLTRSGRGESRVHDKRALTSRLGLRSC